MKGSRVQSIIKELRGEKIDIIEWSDEPSVFAANALSPAKVSQVRITDVNKRDMEVIVVEDQLSLAIGKRGQNVRLATRLVGWNIDIVSEDVLKKEIALKMGKMMASGEAVPITALQIVTANQAEDLKEKGIDNVDTLAATSVDDLVDFLDISLDEAEKIIASAREVVDARNLQSGDSKAESDAAETSEEASETSEMQTSDTDEAPKTAEGNVSEEVSADETDIAEAETSENDSIEDSTDDADSENVAVQSEDDTTENNNEENLS
jgi:N utilization substance protein A